MKNAWTNPNRSFTLLPFPFHWARDSSLSEHPSLPQALAPRFNILCACRDAFDLESAFKNTTSFNLFINSLALWYYHFHCNTKDRKLRSIEGLHKVIKSIHEEPSLHYPAFHSALKFRVTPNSYNALRNLILSILYTFPTSSSSLPVAHVLSVQIPFQEHILICEPGKKEETLQRGSSRPRKTMVFRESAWPLQHSSTPQVSIPVSESQSRASIPGDTYVTLAGPREPGGKW